MMKNSLKHSMLVQLSVTCLLIFELLHNVASQNGLPRLKRPEYDSKNNKLTNFPSVKNGDFVQQEEFESFVSVQEKNGSFLCGGTLLDRDFVLTTASCLTQPNFSTYPTEELMVWSDINNVQNNTGKKSVMQIFIHPNFDPVNLTNDIAMLKIDPFEPGSKTETLTAIEPVQTNATDCKVIGWGQGSDGQFLYKINVELQLPATCASTYPLFNGGDNALCVKGANNSCIEDSASALMCNNEVVGILSFGYGCSDLTKPNVFTDVSKYNEWIDDNFRSVAAEDDQLATTTTTGESGTTATSPPFNFARGDAATTTESGPLEPSTVTSASVSFRTEDPLNQPDLDNRDYDNNMGVNDTNEDDQPLQGSYQIVMDICTAPYLQCCPIWINGYFPITQCRRGFYQYGCYYMVKQFVKQEKMSQAQHYSTPPISRFRSYIQHSSPDRISVVEQIIVHQTENRNRAEAERLGIPIPRQIYEPPPKGASGPQTDRPQFVSIAEEPDEPEEPETNFQAPIPEQPPRPVQQHPIYTTNEVTYFTPPLFGYAPPVQDYAQAHQNWLNQVYCEMIQRSNVGRVQLGLPLVVADSCQAYFNSIPGSSSLRNSFHNVHDQRIYFPSN